MIADDTEIIVIGSQSILGQFPDAPAALRMSIEADLYPAHKPEHADLIDGSIGEHSAFHETFGYYAQGVGEDTAVLPEGWRDRLVRVENPNTNGIVGLCLEVHDLAISKYIAGREKDREFTRQLAMHGMTERKTLLERLKRTKVSDQLRDIVAQRIRNDATRA